MIHPEFLLVVLGAALLPHGRARSLAACAAIAAGLALAGGRVGWPPPDQALPAGFVAVEGALLAIAAVLAVAAGACGVGSPRQPGWLTGSAAAAAGGIGLALVAAPYVASAAVGPLLGALAVVAALGLALATVSRRWDRRATPVESAPSAPAPALGAVAAGALLAAAGTTTGPVFAGAALAAVGGWLIRRASGAARWPIAPTLMLLLVPAWWLMTTIAGPEGLATSSLPDLPWSPAAERLLAPMLLAAAWALSGLWPLHREEPAPLTGPVAALLLARIALPAFPDGLEHWRALVMPVVVIGLWHGVLTRNRGEAVTALAWVGLATVTPPGLAGAALLLLGGLVLELANRLPVGARAAPVLRVGAALAVGTGALWVAEGGLRTEVVYTVVATAALLAGAGRARGVQASTASAPSATAPSA